MPRIYKEETLTDLNFQTIGVRLTILRAGVYDSGTYRCILQNSHGEAQKDIKLTVMPKSRIVQ